MPDVGMTVGTVLVVGHCQLFFRNAYWTQKRQPSTSRKLRIRGLPTGVSALQKSAGIGYVAYLGAVRAGTFEVWMYNFGASGREDFEEFELRMFFQHDYPAIGTCEHSIHVMNICDRDQPIQMVNEHPKPDEVDGPTGTEHEATSRFHAPRLVPTHFLLLLSDSALPLGSFAFSSGLESYLAHQGPGPSIIIAPFLSRSLLSLASTSIPFVLTSYRSPSRVLSLDAEQEACLLCNVTRRASVAQGRALIALWDRSFKAEAIHNHPGIDALNQFSKYMRLPGSEIDKPNGHFAPIWGAVTSALGLTEEDSAYLFLFNHVKSVVSAAVRANVLGPYQAQNILAEKWVRQEIEDTMKQFWITKVEDAGQGWPSLDLWLGRHEKLYSRIFNS